VVKFKGKPDAGNPHVRFDEGEGGCLPPYSTGPGLSPDAVACTLGPQRAHLASLNRGDIHALVYCFRCLGLFCGLSGADLVGGAAGKLLEVAICAKEAPLTDKHGLDAVG